MSQLVLVTGATGKQGGAVIDALLALPNATDFTILAVTRDVTTSSASRLSAKGVKLVQGDLNDIPALFSEARAVAKDQPIWGVYSVQVSMGKGVTVEGEEKQGKALIDESVKAGVKHFVYSSVDRGGDEKSWTTPTPIPHFKSKYEVEKHLKQAAGGMGWTVLRPVAFMDNLVPGFPSKVFMTALRDTLAGKSMQWIATADIGYFAAEAFAHPDEWNHKAVGLAGDQLDFAGISKAFENATGAPVGTTFSMLGSALKWGVAEMGTMLDWFASDGYGAEIGKLRAMNPKLLTMESWLKEKSAFTCK